MNLRGIEVLIVLLCLVIVSPTSGFFSWRAAVRSNNMELRGLRIQSLMVLTSDPRLWVCGHKPEVNNNLRGYGDVRQ